MTKRQIEKKLQAVNISLEYIEINRDEVEIYVPDTDGTCDMEATEKLQKQVSNLLDWGGFRCGHGGWVLRNNYQSMGDWNDRTSQWHY